MESLKEPGLTLANILCYVMAFCHGKLLVACFQQRIAARNVSVTKNSVFYGSVHTGREE